MEPAVIARAPLDLAAARRLLALAVPPPHGFASISIPSSIGGGGGGNGSFFGGGGGGGGGGGDSGAGAAAAAAAAALGETGTADGDVVLLHVGGMSCGGCASKVKRILESQSEVASATVDFDKATAAVWTTPEAKEAEDWQKQLGEKLALHLSNCGFQSHLHGKCRRDVMTDAWGRLNLGPNGCWWYRGRECVAMPHKGSIQTQSRTQVQGPREEMKLKSKPKKQTVDGASAVSTNHRVLEGSN